MHLLSVSADAKTVRGEPYGFLTGILYLQPASLSGKNLCPGSSAGCREACLNYSGRSVAFPKIFAARKRKTEMFLKERETFMLQLASDISTLQIKAKKMGKKPVVRLNGVTDIGWESIPVLGYKNIFRMFPKVKFVDYTKIARRLYANKEKNYHLTFSLSEENESAARKASENGYNVAVVFRDRPKKFWNKKVVDGDRHDLRFLDGKGVIVGLKAKAKAKKDKTGFVK